MMVETVDGSDFQIIHPKKKKNMTRRPGLRVGVSMKKVLTLR